MTKYRDVLKIEFKDAIGHFLKNHNRYHIYRINRLMSNGTLIDFDFYFLPSQNSEKVIQEIDLKEYGKLTFEIDITDSYGKIISDAYKDIINKFIENYDVESKHLGKN